MSNANTEGGYGLEVEAIAIDEANVATLDDTIDDLADSANKTFWVFRPEKGQNLRALLELHEVRSSVSQTNSASSS